MVADKNEEKAEEIVGRSRTVMSDAHDFFAAFGIADLEAVLEGMRRCLKRCLPIIWPNSKGIALT
jgi:hypothetical protein